MVMLRWWVGCVLLGACSKKTSDAEYQANVKRDQDETAALVGAYGKELGQRVEAARSCEKAVVDAAGKALPKGFDPKLKKAPKSAAALDGALLFDIALEVGKAERIGADDDRGIRVRKLAHVETANAACVGPSKADQERFATLQKLGYLDYSTKEELKTKLEKLKQLPAAKPPEVAVVYWSKCKSQQGATYIAKDYSASASTQGSSCDAALAWIHLADGALLAAVAGSGTGTPHAGDSATSDEISMANAGAVSDALDRATGGFASAITKWPP
jgi:hypothetical protein